MRMQGRLEEVMKENEGIVERIERDEEKER